MPRLTSDMWVSAYLTRLRIEAIPAFITHKGDATAGAVLVRLALMNGEGELWARRFDFASDAQKWDQIAQGPDADLDAQIARDRARDPDLWVIEVEDPKGRLLLDETLI